jgi:hypothetical protein
MNDCQLLKKDSVLELDRHTDRQTFISVSNHVAICLFIVFEKLESKSQNKRNLLQFKREFNFSRLERNSRPLYTHTNFAQ